MYAQSLQQAGLTSDQALIYEVLLKNGALKASKVHQKTPLKRGLVYKILEDLLKIGLVEKTEEPGKVAVFSPAHPLKLRDVAKEREQKARDAQVALDGVLGQLSSDYNLTIGKPGVEFFEGLEGVKKVLEDSLTANTTKEICAFSDLGGYTKYLGDWNEKYYAPKRKALGVRLRGIVPNSPQALEFLKGYQATEVTQTLLIDHRLYSFTTEVNIYDNKVSFVTFSERAHIGVIITNEEIYKTFKTLFEFMWTFTKEYSKTLQPGWLTPPSSNPPPSSGAPTLLA